MTVPKVPTVLVTGATGFLGRQVISTFLQKEEGQIIAAARNPQKSNQNVNEWRIGDLRDPEYRKSVVQGIDVLCHCGTWASMWGHPQAERDNFFLPTLDLFEQAIQAGVKRIILTSAVSVCDPPKPGKPGLDDAPSVKRPYWPHLNYLIDIDSWMRANAHRGTGMVVMRLGHFVGAQNRLGLVPAILPRMKTRMMPWLSGGRKRLALVTDEDLGQSFFLAAKASKLDPYESFNICGSEFPTMREFLTFLAEETGLPKPIYSVPYSLGYGFGWLMEKLFPFLPGKAPFLTRSLVLLSEDWFCPSQKAEQKLGYTPQKPWRDAVRESLNQFKDSHFPWPHLAQISK